MPTPYTLVAVTGLSPQVVTECVWELARARDPWLPAAVHLVTTGTGEDMARAVLLADADAAGRASRGRTIAPRAGWAELAAATAAVLPAPEITAPAHAGERSPVADIRDGRDGQLVGDVLYRLLHDLTAEGQPAVVALLSGGRKTMSADLQSAFSVYARPEDRLLHVLVRPDVYERTPDFLFPTADTPTAELDLVEVRVPRLRRLLAGPLLDALPHDRRGLAGILDALAPHNVAGVVARAEVDLSAGALGRSGRRGRCRVRLFTAGGEPLGELTVPVAEAAALIALADAFAARGGAASADDLLTVAVQKAREAAVRVATFDEVTPWSDRRAVSSAVNRLNKALDALPVASALGVSSTRGGRRGDAVVYRPRAAVALTVLGPDEEWIDTTPWPLNHIGRPARLTAG